MAETLQVILQRGTEFASDIVGSANPGGSATLTLVARSGYTTARTFELMKWDISSLDEMKLVTTWRPI